MNMKKIIDETDFDNLNQLSKKWKNPKAKEATTTSPERQKENHSDNALLEHHH